MIPKLYLLLGRLGDLVAILPVMREESLLGPKPTMMVAKEYASLFDGVSYCDCIPFDGDYNDLHAAMEKAKTIADKVICLQVAGPPDAVKQYTYDGAGAEHSTTDSFIKEQWKFAGAFGKWKDQPPLIFDRRNPAREAAMFNGTLSGKKKLILVYLDGVSSPFPYKPLCLELLRLKFPKAQIVDLGELKADRFYDFLALYEKAHCLVSSDSAPLHLAYACVKTLPVVALIKDQPILWHGSPWRANHIAHIRYSDFPHRAMEMLDAIENIKADWRFNRFAINWIHVWSCYEINEENSERAKAAKKAWGMAAISCPVEVGAVGQDSASILKDDKRYPTVKDVIRIGCMMAGPDDVILLTRCDTCPTEGLFERLSQQPLPAYAHRTIRDKDGDTYHPAVDLFAFKKAWWDEHVKEFPTMIMGMDTLWNRVLLDLFLKHGARELPFAVHRPPGNPIMPLKEAPKRLLHNETAAKVFWKENPSVIEPPKVTEQASGGWSINRHSIKPYGYNPSIIRFNGRLLMAYRWHPEHESQTRLAIAELSDDFSVMNDRDIFVQARSAEDPRLFIYNGNLHIGFVDSSWPEVNPKCVTKYGKLREYQDHWLIEDIHQPMIGRNDGASLEKNFVFWDSGHLTCLYQTAPELIVHCMSGDQSLMSYKTPGPRWSWGAMRGGSVPFKYKDGWLRFFHSGLDNEPPPWRRRYYLGAMLINQPTPPFNVLAVSKEPILRGSERDDLNEMERSGCSQYKSKVVFSLGAIEHEDGWLLSCGINDAYCGLIKIIEKDLHL